MSDIKNIVKLKKVKPNDVVFTPEPLAKVMIDMCDIKETDKVLDCSLGEGVFYNNYPKCEKDWCEITKGRDFFKYTEGKRYDWVIGNPPYSMWSKWLDQTCKITDKFCYILGTTNLTETRLKKLAEKGFGITKIKLVNVDWWFMTHFCMVFEKNKKSIISFEDRFNCDICGKRCKRGRKINGKKWGVNECSNQK